MLNQTMIISLVYRKIYLNYKNRTTYISMPIPYIVFRFVLYDDLFISESLKCVQPAWRSLSVFLCVETHGGRVINKYIWFTLNIYLNYKNRTKYISLPIPYLVLWFVLYDDFFFLWVFEVCTCSMAFTFCIFVCVETQGGLVINKYMPKEEENRNTCKPFKF